MVVGDQTAAGLADVLGRVAVFSAVAGVGVVMVAMTLRIPPPPATGSAGWRMLREAVGTAPVRFGFLLILVPGMIFGAIDVLVPLEMDVLGAGGHRHHRGLLGVGRS